jgi:hypothetical protein
MEERVLEEGLGDEYRQFRRTRERLIPAAWWGATGGSGAKPGYPRAANSMFDDVDRESPQRPAPLSEAEPAGVGPLRSTGRVPPLLSVALVGVVLGLLVGFGFGYRLGMVAPPPTPTPTAPDLQAGSVSSRLERAVRSAAPDGWAVCGLGRDVACQELAARTIDLAHMPAYEYGLGWYSDRDLTRVTVSPARAVLAASLGDGSVAAYLNRVGAEDTLLGVVDLTPVSPGGRGTYYFDLGTLAPGHYVVQVDFMAAPPSESAGVVFYIVGFVVS